MSIKACVCFVCVCVWVGVFDACELLSRFNSARSRIDDAPFPFHTHDELTHYPWPLPDYLIRVKASVMQSVFVQPDVSIDAIMPLLQYCEII